ncbi:MAG: hypothetical protein IKU43_05755 [Clostridia bacterium]|nr:hypothetical protein [Clostridia bacterium]
MQVTRRLQKPQRQSSAKIIQKRLGHSDITTTLNIYAHALPSANKEAGNTIDNRILGTKQA